MGGDGTESVLTPSLIDICREMGVEQPRWDWVHVASLLRLLNIAHPDGTPRDSAVCPAIEAVTLYHCFANALRHTGQQSVAMQTYAMLLRRAAKLGLWTLIYHATAELEEIFAADGLELPHRHELSDALMQASAAALASEDDEMALAAMCRGLACKLTT
jgi:hypothetical protein